MLDLGHWPVYSPISYARRPQLDVLTRNFFAMCIVAKLGSPITAFLFLKEESIRLPSS